MVRFSLYRSVVPLFMAAVALLLAATPLAAVPAMPGSGHHGAATACPSHAGNLVTPADIAADGGPGLRQKALDGKDLPLLVIVVGFPNMPYDGDFRWSDTIFLGERSLRAYYSDMSDGRFTFAPAGEQSVAGGDVDNAYDAIDDGIVYVDVDRPHQAWHRLDTADEVTDFLTVLSEAVTKADAVVDFAAYDSDKNGAISTDELAVAFVIAGYEAAATNVFAMGRDKYMWSHAWSIREAAAENGLGFKAPRVDGVEVSSYIAISEYLEDGAVKQSPIGVLAHELGHYLGLPDLYDTSDDGVGPWSDFEVGSLSLMDSGAWGRNGNGDLSPYSLDIWSRITLDWVTPTVADACGRYRLVADTYTADGATAEALKIPGPKPDEYYLLENRSYVKWDEALGKEFAADLHGGIILWHIDDGVYAAFYELNAVNNVVHRPAVMPLYPESAHGNIVFRGGVPDLKRPFFAADVWARHYAAVGETLELPLYGSGNSGDDPAARRGSDLDVRFLTDSGPVMELAFNDHELAFTAAKAATCDAGGNVAYWHCSRCGHYYADAEATRWLAATDVFQAALGHAWDDGVVTVAATATTAGKKVFTCRRDPSHTFSVTIPATGAVAKDLNYEDHIAYVKGYNDGTVRPKANVTRAEAATMLYRLLTAEKRAELVGKTATFKDVTPKKWYAEAVTALAAAGCIKGYPDGTFGGEKPITRAEFVSILSQLVATGAAAPAFKDVAANYWAKEAIATATAFGWVNGYPDGTFRPAAKITRAEVVTTLNRLLNRGISDDKDLGNIVFFKDNVVGAWYYYEIIEATNDHTYIGGRPNERWTSR